jgi:hypothetical protein
MKMSSLSVRNLINISSVLIGRSVLLYRKVSMIRIIVFCCVELFVKQTVEYEYEFEIIFELDFEEGFEFEFQFVFEF